MKERKIKITIQKSFGWYQAWVDGLGVIAHGDEKKMKETSKTNDPNVIFIRHSNGETETKYVNSDFECSMKIRKRDKRIKL